MSYKIYLEDNITSHSKYLTDLECYPSSRYDLLSLTGAQIGRYLLVGEYPNDLLIDYNDLSRMALLGVTLTENGTKYISLVDDSLGLDNYFNDEDFNCYLIDIKLAVARNDIQWEEGVIQDSIQEMLGWGSNRTELALIRMSWPGENNIYKNVNFPQPTKFQNSVRLDVEIPNKTFAEKFILSVK